jgi:hypothetical protein
LTTVKVSFSAAVQAMNQGKHVRFVGWGEGSEMYADKNGQLMRTPNRGAINKSDYAWTLTLKELNGKWVIL